MTPDRRALTNADLMAYTDGLLESDPQRGAEVETFLDCHPASAARIRDYIAQNRRIRRLYADVLTEPIPPRFTVMIEPHRGVPVPRVARTIIAASLLIAAGFAGWWIGQSESRTVPADPLAQEALVPAPPSPMVSHLKHVSDLNKM